MARVKYFGTIRALTEKQEEEISGETVSGLMKEIKSKHGLKAYRIAKRSHIVVNGESVNLHGGFSMKIRENDVVKIMPVCGGG